MRRVARYLRGCPRCVTRYDYQEVTDQFILFTDSDGATEARGRKSHSGGAICLGGHLLQHWSRIQSVIALSSAEAELYSSVTGITRALGLLHLGRDIWGGEWGRIQHRVDSSACKSILCRKGAGSVKHLATKDLWVQEAVKRYGIEVTKIDRKFNPSDSMASFSTSVALKDHMQMLNCEAFAIYHLGPRGGE